MKFVLVRVAQKSDIFFQCQKKIQKNFVIIDFIYSFVTLNHHKIEHFKR